LEPSLVGVNVVMRLVDDRWTSIHAFGTRLVSTCRDPGFLPSRSEHGLSGFLRSPLRRHRVPIPIMRRIFPRWLLRSVITAPTNRTSHTSATSTLDALRIQACPDQSQVWPRYSVREIAIRNTSAVGIATSLGEILLRRPYVRSWPRPPKIIMSPSILAPRAMCRYPTSGQSWRSFRFYEGQASPRRPATTFLVRDPLRVSGPAESDTIVADTGHTRLAGFARRWIHSTFAG